MKIKLIQFGMAFAYSSTCRINTASSGVGGRVTELRIIHTNMMIYIIKKEIQSPRRHSEKHREILENTSYFPKDPFHFSLILDEIHPLARPIRIISSLS